MQLMFSNREDWRDGLRQHVLALDCSVSDPRSFQCDALIGRMCGTTVAELRVGASRLMRRAVDIDDCASASVKVVWQLAGRSRIQQGPSSARLEAGAWTICDPAREYAIDADKGAHFLLLLVPRAQCPGWLPAMQTLAACALPARGPAHIAMVALAAILREASPFDAESEATLQNSVVALIERALKIELGLRGFGAGHADRSIHLAQVQAYVLEHLADPGLNVARLAAVFGVSRRSLYNAFVPSGVTPHAFIQSAKLDRACVVLSDPALRYTPVADIARHCGFADPAHFTRAFHARHGVAPTAWRSRPRDWENPEACTNRQDDCTNWQVPVLTV